MIFLKISPLPTKSSDCLFCPWATALALSPSHLPALNLELIQWVCLSGSCSLFAISASECVPSHYPRSFHIHSPSFSHFSLHFPFLLSSLSPGNWFNQSTTWSSTSGAGAAAGAGTGRAAELRLGRSGWRTAGRRGQAVGPAASWRPMRGRYSPLSVHEAGVVREEDPRHPAGAARALGGHRPLSAE